jgi:Fe-S cluster assembly protein SufB
MHRGIDMSQDARDAVGDYKYGFHDPENATIRFDSGLSEQVVRDISELKNEPQWMTDMRVKAFKHFISRPMPDWGNSEMLNSINFESICYYLKSSKGSETDWDEVPDDIGYSGC